MRNEAPVLRCWSLGWPRPGRYVVPSKSSPRPGPRRTENVDGEGVRRDPCGQNPRRRCAMRVRPVPDCQAALGLSARRRSADLQRTDRPGSSIGSWTTSPAAIQMYTNERISDLEARWSRCSCCISSGVTMFAEPSRGRARCGGRGGCEPRPRTSVQRRIRQALGPAAVTVERVCRAMG